MNRAVRSAWVIGRRDFVATVWSKTFAFFLIGPLLIIGISFGFGKISGDLAREDTRPQVAVIAPQAEFAELAATRERLNPAFGVRQLPDLIHAEPDYDLALQTSNLLAERDKRIAAVLVDPFGRPRLTGALSETSMLLEQVGVMIDEARQQRRLAGTLEPVRVELVRVEESAGSEAAKRRTTAVSAQVLLFMLTIFLSTMLLSNLVEEKSTKVIEVLAAAVPVDSIFMGKLFSMLAISIVGIVVWAAAVALGLLAWPSSAGGIPQPAVGWPLFIAMIVLYYSTNYLLLGALFLGIGAQATSVREVQTLSMPVTMGQMLVFFFAMFALGAYNGVLGIAAAIFPFSSPLAMIARAAQTPELWPHLVALAWQALWVWLMIALGASLFRRNVLKSGAALANVPRRSWRQRA